MAEGTRISQSDLAGVTASADLSAAAHLHKIVLLGSTGLTAGLCGAGGKGCGTLVNSPESGDPIDIDMHPDRAQLDGSSTAIAVGDWLKCDANGRLVKTTTDTDVVLAKSLCVCTAQGDIGAIEWGPFTLSA